MTRALSHFSLLYSIMAGPIVWALQFVLVYMVAEFGCRANFNNVVYFTPETIRLICVVITVIALLAVAFGGLLAYRNWQALPNRQTDTTANDYQTRFLISLGALLTPLFLLSIIATVAPVFIVSVCDRAA